MNKNEHIRQTRGVTLPSHCKKKYFLRFVITTFFLLSNRLK